MPSVPIDEPAWQQERFNTYLSISISVRHLNDLLRKTQTAINAVGNQGSDLADGKLATDILSYCAEHPSHQETDLSSITAIDAVQEAFEESKARATKVGRMLWADENAFEAARLGGVDGFTDARVMVKEIGGQVQAWEKRLTDITASASALAA